MLRFVQCVLWITSADNRVAVASNFTAVETLSHHSCVDAVPIVRDLFGKGLYEPTELIALEALLERKYSEPLPKKNAKGHITGIPPPTSTGQASQNAA